MEKFDVIPEAENVPARGDFPRIGNSNYRFNLWYEHTGWSFPIIYRTPAVSFGLASTAYMTNMINNAMMDIANSIVEFFVDMSPLLV